MKRFLVILALTVPSFAQVLRPDQVRGTAVVQTPAAPQSALQLNAKASPIYFPGLTAFGDSITEHFGYSPPAGSIGYAQLLANDLGGAYQNFAIFGDESGDMSNKVVADYTPQDQRNPNVTMMIGVNDAQVTHCGLAAGCMDNYTMALRASLVWAAIPSSYKILGQNSVCAKTGTWNNINWIGTSIVSDSSVSGSTQSCTITTTAPSQKIWASWVCGSVGTGVATISIDGIVVDTVYGYGNTGHGCGTLNNPTWNAAHAKGYQVGAGTHTVIWKVLSGDFGWISLSTTPQNYYQYGQPRVFLGGVMRTQNDANAATTAAYDAESQALVAEVQGDGAYVLYVPVRDPLTSLNDTTDMFDTYHPSTGTDPLAGYPGHASTGDSKLRDVFELTMQPAGVAAISANPTGPQFINGQKLIMTSSDSVHGQVQFLNPTAGGEVSQLLVSGSNGTPTSPSSVGGDAYIWGIGLAVSDGANCYQVGNAASTATNQLIYKLCPDGSLSHTGPSSWGLGSSIDSSSHVVVTNPSAIQTIAKDLGVTTIVTTSTTPGSGSVSCTPRALWADNSFIYHCNSAGTAILRVALTTF